MEKTRQLSISEYLKILQLEYLTYKVRELIFDKPEFIKMNKDIANKKKEKIINLCEKFRLDSIFSSIEKFQDFWNNIFLNEFGLPNLQYSIVEEKKLSQVFFDKVYLLNKNTIVFYKNVECVVLYNNIEKNELSILFGNKSHSVSYDQVKIKNLVTCFDGKLM